MKKLFSCLILAFLMFISLGQISHAAVDISVVGTEGVNNLGI